MRQRAASVDLKRLELSAAERRATSALHYASALERPSEIALARSILGLVSLQKKDLISAQSHAQALRDLNIRNVSNHARTAIQAFLSARDLTGKEAPPHGNRGRGKNVRTAR